MITGPLWAILLWRHLPTRLGLNQFWLGTQQGRFNAENGKNFNRHYPDLGAAVAERIEGRLTDDANANVELIRKSCLEWLAESAPETAVDVLKHTLLSHSIDADIVLDLHCDLEALMYMFILPELLPEASDLAAYLGCRGLLLAEPSPDMCFDEANSLVWRKLAQRFTDFPIPHACMSTTLELRGMSDVNSALAEQDAKCDLCLSTKRGIIAGEPKPVPECNASLRLSRLLGRLSHPAQV